MINSLVQPTLIEKYNRFSYSIKSSIKNMPDTNSSQHDIDENNEKKQIKEFFNQMKEGICVEIGSNEPVSICSQSMHLERDLNWKCVLVEPNPSLANKTRKLRPSAIVVQLGCTSVNEKKTTFLNIPLDINNNEITGHASLEINADEHNYSNHKSLKIKTDTLTNILRLNNINNIDFLSIDVEGTELEVLLGLDFKSYRPKLILLEDKHLYLKKHILLKNKGYKLVQRLNRNCWYIPKEIPSPSVSLMAKIKLLKRIYLSIWLRKASYSLLHRSLRPFKTL